MLIQPIVEGPGDVSAVPVLLRRICYELGCCLEAQIAHPMKVSRSKMVQREHLDRYIRIAAAQKECGLILLFMDSDDNCARELAETVRPWMVEAARRIPSELIVIPREYEGWFISAMESLRGVRSIRPDAISSGEPERVRDAKGVITDWMEGSTAYHESADQAALTQKVDLQAVRQKCGAFRRLIGKIEQYGAFCPISS